MNDTEKTMTDLLRDALRESTGDARADKMAHETIRAGIVRDDPQLLQVWVEEVGPPQALLDLHLGGPGVDGHSTNASDFGHFITSVADAVKETAKGISGMGKYSAELLIEGATPGSVRVVLKAPPRQAKDEDAAVEEVSSVDSQALRAIAQVLAVASEEDGPDGGPLDASVQGLPAAARVRLKTAIEYVRRSAWEIDGSIQQRHKGIGKVELTHDGAVRLSRALQKGHEEMAVERILGTVDGLKHSLGVMWFAPEGGRSFSATVLEDRLLSKVASLAATPELSVIAVFDTFTTVAEGSTTLAKKSRRLRSIELVPVTDEFTDFHKMI